MWLENNWQLHNPFNSLSVSAYVRWKYIMGLFQNLMALLNDRLLRVDQLGVHLENWGMLKLKSNVRKQNSYQW